MSITLTGRKYPWLRRSNAMPNHYYFYAVDEDFGPFFLKVCSYFPYNGKLCFILWVSGWSMTDLPETASR